MSAARKRTNARIAEYKKEQRAIGGAYAIKEKARGEEDRKRPEVKKQRAVLAIATRNKNQEQQAGRPRSEQCEVCGRRDKIVFDHCHASTKFRGWLCFKCNAVLGFVDDNPHILELLAAYLRDHDDSPDVYTS